MRFKFDKNKSRSLRDNPRRKIGFEEAREIFYNIHIQDQISDNPEQYRAVGWVRGKLYTVVFEQREDEQGEYYHLVTLWKSTKQEREAYEEHT